MWQAWARDYVRSWTFWIVAAILIITIGCAFGHDHWLNSEKIRDGVSGEWCCNEDDCRPEPVREVRHGYIVETGEFIPVERVAWKSPDGKWWRCRYLHDVTFGGVVVHKAGTTRCLIGPPPNS